MRSVRSFIADVIKKPPAIFPWLALFHVGMFFYTLALYIHEPFPSIGWLQPLWMFSYAIIWLFVCDLRKWAAYCYLGLTLINVLLFFNLKSINDRDLYTSSLFLVDVLFSFFILFFFRRFE